MYKHRHFGSYGLIIDEDRILLIRKSRGAYTGKLDLPGGSFEHGESPLETVKREIMEEVGVNVLSATLVDGDSCNVVWFNKERDDDYFHFILLAKDAIGHQQIREISTRAWMHSYMARGMRRVPTYYQDLFDVIGKNPGHVIGSTACLGGAIPTPLLRLQANPSLDLFEKIKTWIRQMNDLFGQENFYLELKPSESHEQTYVNRKLINLS